MSVNEKSEKVLEQYDIGIRRMVRGRGGIIVQTDQGYKLFIQCEKADRYYERENKLTQVLDGIGYTCIDTYMRNKEGLIISEDEDGRKYIMKNWFDAKESNVKDENDMCMAVSAMAYMHVALRQITPDMLYVQDNVCDESTELEACQKVRRITGYTKETELRKTYAKHTRELKKAYNYLKQKKGKQIFEQIAFKNIEVFYEEACRANEQLMSEAFDERLMMAAQNM